ncbi:MAG: hypothetical protein Kow0037_19480 [Calditrichia bacterium]
MNGEMLNIVYQAELLTADMSGRIAHRVNSLITQIYLLCSVKEYEKARILLKELNRLVSKEKTLFPKLYSAPLYH